jgi:hypothetical protein
MDRDLAPAVDCYAGGSACDHPTQVIWEDKTLRVTRIVKEWREPGSKSYLVQTENSKNFNLTLSETSGEWLVSEVNLKIV